MHVFVHFSFGYLTSHKPTWCFMITVQSYLAFYSIATYAFVLWKSLWNTCSWCRFYLFIWNPKLHWLMAVLLRSQVVSVPRLHLNPLHIVIVGSGPHLVLGFFFFFVLLKGAQSLKSWNFEHSVVFFFEQFLNHHCRMLVLFNMEEKAEFSVIIFMWELLQRYCPVSPDWSSWWL